ncbi:hypothetical protein L249_3692 [Ophiocordyceps polyrhachis-furcata BCC 54312]|uniref:Uncharacterized protein n=1 Tax=Ophiocordyceps polyrhachis-furcata BCC 54312 TaxID=1330021 RepID=A0A367L4J1_9HYPO|nr:hypothetical protein L249_3692 [Ophiocordyceps polyrhachis-furcata BCC 54312]
MDGRLKITTAQRPCSRCLSNGKEDACVDVQHKKRGRPRLRDEREARYDPLRPPQYPDLSLRRPPLNVFPSGSEDVLVVGQRHPSYALDAAANSATTLTPRPPPFERVDAYGCSPPPPPSSSSSSSSSLAPIAYLTMGMEFAKASPTFVEAVGALSLTGRKLADVVAGSELERIRGMQSRLVAEQKRREPNYLPPILGLGGPAFQGVGFAPEDVIRFPLTLHEQLTFVGPDGYQRLHPLRVGLGREGSFFFVVMLLTVVPPAARYPHQPNRVSPVASYPGMPSPFEAFDPVRHRVSEGPPPGMRPTLPGQQNQPSPAAAAGGRMASSPGVMSPASPYASRNRYSGPVPPTEALSSFARGRSGPQGGRIQLPPIRAPPPPPPPPPPPSSDRRPSSGPWSQRDERTSRVDIGGLIDKPEGSGKPR